MQPDALKRLWLITKPHIKRAASKAEILPS